MNKYITREDYLKAKGVDLEIEVAIDDNPSNTVDRFIEETTDWCVDYIFHEYAENDINDFEHLAEFRQKFFREGVIEQIEYILNNGWINKDSGIIKETGMILNYDTVQLGYNAFLKFRRGAFCNIKRG